MAKIRSTAHGTKKDAILKKAAASFRHRGFKATSMRELADKIGVEAPSLYNHIGSKAELLQDICFKVAEEFTQHLATVEENSDSSAKKIEQLIRFHIKMMLQFFDEVYVANHEWKHLEDNYLGTFLNQRKSYETRMVELIKVGIANHELRNIHPHVAALTILSAVRSLEFWQRHKKEISAEVLEENMVNHLLNGLTK